MRFSFTNDPTGIGSIPGAARAGIDCHHPVFSNGRMSLKEPGELVPRKAPFGVVFEEDKFIQP
jgi:hypothetical protein